MERRNFIKLSFLTVLALSMNIKVFGDEIKSDRVVVFIELDGGNDGLNTVIPYGDDRYYSLRSSLAIKKEDVIALDDKLGFHPKLQEMKKIWDEDELAVILGVGYENPNRSHFRSIEIWNTASDSDEYLTDGWVGKVFSQSGLKGDFSDTITIGKGENSLFAHKGMNNIVFNSPQSFVKKAKDVPYIDGFFDDEMLSYVVSTQNELHNAVELLKNKLTNPEKLNTKFPKYKLADNFKNIAFLLKNGIKAPVFKVTLSGFDTHSNQAPTHERLLEEFSKSLDAFRDALIEIGYWDKVLIMTYSEFGRRPAENASKGTDHGTASVHFMIGGGVKGGFYSTQPSLEDLDDNGDLKYTIDYRSLYSTVVRKWWKINGTFLDAYSPIDCIRV